MVKQQILKTLSFPKAVDSQYLLLYPQISCCWTPINTMTEPGEVMPIYSTKNWIRTTTELSEEQNCRFCYRKTERWTE